MDTYLQEAVELLIVTKGDEYREKRQEIASAIKALRAKLARLKPLAQRTSKQEILEMISKLESEDDVLHMAQQGYTVRFSLEALKMRYADGPNEGLPVFGVFDFGKEQDFTVEPNRTLLFNGSGVSGVDLLDFTPLGLPEDIRRCFSDLLAHLTLVPKVKIRLAACWSGVIPDDVDEAVDQAQKSGFFERVYLVPQIADWTVSARRIEPRPLKSDPFVIGLRRGNWYLIAKFDPTDLEEYISTHFTLD